MKLLAVAFVVLWIGRPPHGGRGLKSVPDAAGAAHHAVVPRTGDVG